MDDNSALDGLWAAYHRYVDARNARAAIEPCRSWWPGDPPGPDYPGTSCDLVEGHEGAHRRRITGSTMDVTW